MFDTCSLFGLSVDEIVEAVDGVDVIVLLLTASTTFAEDVVNSLWLGCEIVVSVNWPLAASLA